MGALPGLTIESAILLPVAALIAGSYAIGEPGTVFGSDLWLSALIVFSGVVTAVPLLLFAIAARRMEYSTLGFIQYMAPTIVFLLGLFVFGEELKPVQLASFGLIWTAVAIFAGDLIVRSRRAKRAQLAT